MVLLYLLIVHMFAPRGNFRLMRYFCTLFDSGYLLKGVAMLQSLERYCSDAHVYVMCMDQRSREVLESLKFSFVTCLNLSEVEDEALLEVKKERGVAEYCWTLSPCLPLYLLKKYHHIDFLTYLDADLLFFSSVEPIFEEIGGASIAIIEHRFSPRLKDREINGRFCVEWVSFRRDEEGLACLSRWREQCIEWCFYRLEDGKMGDQKYLDEWPEIYSRCHIIEHRGAGMAPWNYSQYQFSKDQFDNVLVDDVPLIFYHFHQFQLLSDGTYDRLSSFYTSECKEPDLVYDLYESDLRKIFDQVMSIDASIKDTLKKPTRVALRRFAQVYLPAGFKNWLRSIIKT